MRVLPGRLKEITVQIVKGLGGSHEEAVLLSESLVRADIVDLRLPIGGLELRDLALIGMLGLLILRGLVHKTLSRR